MYVAQTQVQDEITGDYAGGPGGRGRVHSLEEWASYDVNEFPWLN